MSRSRKRTPISGVTKARSEKADKRFWHRRLRRKVRTTIDRAEPVFPHAREVSNPWAMAKDGKRYFGSDGVEKWLRK